MMKELFNKWLEEQHYKNLSPKTISEYKRIVGDWLEFIGNDCKTFTAKEVKWYHTELKLRGLIDSGIQMRMKYIKSFYRWAIDHNQDITETHLTAFTKLKYIKDDRRETVYSREEMLEIGFKARSTRDHLAVCLMSVAALRINEVATLKVENICFNTKTITIENKGRIRTVGGSPELPGFLFDTIQQYMHEEGIESGKLMLVCKRTIARSVEAMLPRGSSHLLRATAAARIYKQSGHDLIQPKKLLGHKKLETTLHYLDRYDSVATRVR